MNVGSLIVAGLATFGTIATVTGQTVIGQTVTGQMVIPPQRVMAQQTAPGEPQQNDRRPSIARINPQKPIQIRVVSQTKVPVVASLGTAVGDRPVAPGKSVTFGRLHTSYLSVPLDLQVTLPDSTDPNNPIGVFLDVKTAGNEIIVGVKTAVSGGGNTSQTVSVDQKGLVYVF
ncbi:MAG: hypothetical protein NW224_24070 [Leptolyngbyaceae cyanobacterium bins.302]|nr:hypothetical protein [Leptolyngbyaceae cyanobacterium bins.302]